MSNHYVAHLKLTKYMPTIIEKNLLKIKEIEKLEHLQRISV